MNKTFRDLPLFRNTDPTTSKAAAESLNPEGHRAILLAEYAKHPEGLTAEEAGIKSELITTGAGYWKRVSDLKRLGLVEDTGTERAGSSGRMQAVLRITDKGRQVWQGG